MIVKPTASHNRSTSKHLWLHCHATGKIIIGNYSKNCSLISLIVWQEKRKGTTRRTMYQGPTQKKNFDIKSMKSNKQQNSSLGNLKRREKKKQNQFHVSYCDLASMTIRFSVSTMHTELTSHWKQFQWEAWCLWWQSIKLKRGRWSIPTPISPHN